MRPDALQQPTDGMEVAPRRLVESEDEVGRVLRTALEHVPRGIEHACPVAEFHRASERLRARRRLRWPLLAAAAAGCLWYVAPRQSHRDASWTASAPLIEAERWVQTGTEHGDASDRSMWPGSQDGRREAPAAAGPRGGPQREPIDDRAVPSPNPPRAPRPTEGGLPNAKASDPLAADGREEPTPEVLDGAPDGKVGERTACHLLARAGSYEQATDCYAEQARGTGVSAELAWLEKARVERRALHAPQRALATLSAYSQRFPGGALRPEASLTRLELLDELGHLAEALALIDGLLIERLVPARGAELRAMRARLLARSGRCSEAEEALEEARRTGASDGYSAGVREHCAAPSER